MTIASGLGWTTLTIADAGAVARDIRDNISSLSFSTPRAVWDITGLGASAFVRTLLLADMSVEIEGMWDSASNKIHDVFKTAPSTAVARAIGLTVNGATLGTTPAVTLLPTDYAVERADGGELTCKIPLVLANGAVPAWT